MTPAEALDLRGCVAESASHLTAGREPSPLVVACGAVSVTADTAHGAAAALVHDAAARRNPDVPPDYAPAALHFLRGRLNDERNTESTGRVPALVVTHGRTGNDPWKFKDALDAAQYLHLVAEAVASLANGVKCYRPRTPESASVATARHLVTQGAYGLRLALLKLVAEEDLYRTPAGDRILPWAWWWSRREPRRACADLLAAWELYWRAFHAPTEAGWELSDADRAELAALAVWLAEDDAATGTEPDRKPDTKRKSRPPAMPSDDTLAELIRALKRRVPKGESRIAIAREIAGAGAESLLRQARRYRHFWDPAAGAGR